MDEDMGTCDCYIPSICAEGGGKGGLDVLEQGLEVGGHCEMIEGGFR